MYKLTEKELSKYSKIEFRYVVIRKNRKQYELYNELDRSYVETKDINSAINWFNTMVENNTKKLELM